VRSKRASDASSNVRVPGWRYSSNRRSRAANDDVDDDPSGRPRLPQCGPSTLGFVVPARHSTTWSSSYFEEDGATT